MEARPAARPPDGSVRLGLIRTLPLPIRLPLIRGALAAVRMTRSGRWTAPAPLDRIQPGPLVVTGFLDEVLGIGKAGRMTVDAVSRAGFSVTPDPLRPAMRRVWSGRQPALPAGPGGVWLIHANAPETEIALMAHDPADWAGRYRIGYWAWETPQAPASWARAARWLHEVWTPSRFVADAVGAAMDGIGWPEGRERLRVMPHPVRAPETITPQPGRFGLTPGKRHALVMFDGRSAYARKNPWGAIEAWTRAYPEPAPDADLIVKAVSLDTDPKSARRLRALAAGRPDIVLVEDHLSDDDLWSLLDGIDLLISTHRSEGFGLVPAEAMALGKPVIVTGWSAVTEFVGPDAGVLLPYRLTPVRDPTGAYRGAVWAEPDLDACARAIRELMDNPDRAKALGRAGPARAAALSEPWSAENLNRAAFAALVDKSARRPVP